MEDSNLRSISALPLEGSLVDRLINLSDCTLNALEINQSSAAASTRNRTSIHPVTTGGLTIRRYWRKLEIIGAVQPLLSLEMWIVATGVSDTVRKDRVLITPGELLRPGLATAHEQVC